MGIYNSTVILTTIWGIYFFIRNYQQVWQYFKVSNFIWMFGLIIIPMLISLLSSDYVDVTSKSIMNFARFFFIGALALLLTSSLLKKIHFWVLIYILIVSIDAVIEWLTGYHLMGESRDRARIMGLFQYYHLGYVLATLTPVIFYQTVVSFINKKNIRYFWLIASCITVFAILIGGSRAGVVTLLVSLGLVILYMIIQKKISLKLVSSITMVVIIVGIFISQVPIIKNRYINVLQSTEQEKIGSYAWVDKVSSHRLVLWQFAWNEYKKSPVIGVGSGTYEKAFSTLPVEERGVYVNGQHFPHFFGLEVLSQTGSIGFICYLLVLGIILTMLLTAKQFSVWLAISFLSMMPINLHVSFYGSFWAVLIWIPLVLGLRERYMLMQKEPANT